MGGAAGGQGADGLAFVVQRDPRGASALGNDGQGLGYGNSPTAGGTAIPIAPSLAVEFDTHLNPFDPSSNHIAITRDGDVSRHFGAVSPAFGLNDGRQHYAWIDYQPATRLLLTYLSDTDVKPAAPVLSEYVDLSGLVGGDVFFGFTAATGSVGSYHDILSWELKLQDVPEVGSLALLLSALAGLGLCRRQPRPRAA
jgi:hypothetical protein